MTDTWVDCKARIKPSGHIHLVEYVRPSGRGRTRDLLILACGKEARRDYMTLLFPSEGRQCGACFPPADDRSSSPGASS